MVARITLTHWGWVAHICVSKLTIIDSDNGLSPGRCQAIIWTNAGILLIGPLGANFSEMLIEILTFSFKKMQFKISSAKWRPFCLGLNGLKSHRNLWSIITCPCPYLDAISADGMRPGPETQFMLKNIFRIVDAPQVINMSCFWWIYIKSYTVLSLHCTG